MSFNCLLRVFNLRFISSTNIELSDENKNIVRETAMITENISISDFLLINMI
ncbi:hypothetical protein PLUTE_a5063 [Pseudoalteromonas luteoviolacea DSM 6061]|nr:hypothetical protein [Pseudoalteromonas luteoviolacea DSM 6061]